MSTLFVLKNVRGFFFSQAGKQGFKHILESSPPQSTSNSVKDTRTVFWSSKIEILRCLETDREGGGVEFDAILSIFFCILEKKTQGHFLAQKE